MTRRRLLIPLHWATAFLLLAMVKGGTAAEWVRWAYVACGLAWLGLMAAGWPLARPGPKLRGAMRAGFAPAHWAIYAVLAASVALNALALIDPAWTEPAWTSLLVLLGIAGLHAIFHLWRHTALNDGALRMILPRVLHRHL